MLIPQSAIPLMFLGSNRTAGFPNRGKDCLIVQGLDRMDVDDLSTDPLFFKDPACLNRLPDQVPGCKDGNIFTLCSA